MYSFEFACPDCGEICDATDSEQGFKKRCPHCNKEITVPLVSNGKPKKRRKLLTQSDSPITDLTYDEWNKSIGRYCFNSRNANQKIRFSVDPMVLHQAAVEGPCHYHFPTSDDAYEDFCTSVTHQINQDGWDLGSTREGEIPDGLAKLALQVLAVFKMSSDEEGVQGYWAALLKTLGRNVERAGKKPADLASETHQKNWKSLVAWANEQNEGSLGELNADTDLDHDHVKYPLSHGLLRRADIQNLSKFFVLVNILPGEEVEPDDILNSLESYATDPDVFSPHAQRLLQDEGRLPLAAKQVAIAAAQWDGLTEDHHISRSPVIRLWLAIHRSISPHVSGGLLEFVPNEPIKLVSDVSLEDLLRQGVVQRRYYPVAYKPINQDMLIGVRSQLDNRFVESRVFHLGDDVVIAKRDQQYLAQTEEKEISRIAMNGRLDRLVGKSAGIPDGWILYRFKVRDDLTESDVPDFLSRRLKIMGVRLHLSGGLKLGKKGWIEGAGPTLRVKGGNAKSVIVDDIEYQLKENCLYPEKCPALNAIGSHEAWIPGRHFKKVRFRVVSASPVRFKSPVVDAGWTRIDKSGWPIHFDNSATESSSHIRGPVVEGDWPAAKSPIVFAPAEQVAIQLAVALRQPPLACGEHRIAALKANNQRHPNLLIRQLTLAIQPISNKRKRVIQ